MENKCNTQIDSTLVKMMLKSIQEGDINVIKSNITKYSLDLKMVKDYENEQNAFFYASLIKDDNDALAIFKYFKDLGVDPLLRDKHYQTCLYYCCREGKYLTSKYLIEECHVPVNEKDIYGQHPIYYATREGRLKICELLIEKGADANLEDKYGQTCIYYAIRQNHYEIVEFLILHGADVNKIDKKKQIPVVYAEKMGLKNIAELLISNGAKKPEVKPKEKKTKGNSKKEINVNDKKTKQEIIESIQKPKKNVLVKIMPNGEKVPLTQYEIEQFKIDNPEVSMCLFNKEHLAKMTSECNDEYCYIIYHYRLRMHDSWEKIAKKLMTSLWKVRDAEVFHRPVNTIELGLPDYFDKIKHPMDFSTVKQKLNNFQYTNLKEFCSDMELIWNNCYEYNGEKSIVGVMCTNVKNEYKKLFVSLEMEAFL